VGYLTSKFSLPTLFTGGPWLLSWLSHALDFADATCASRDGHWKLGQRKVRVKSCNILNINRWGGHSDDTFRRYVRRLKLMWGICKKSQRKALDAENDGWGICGTAALLLPSQHFEWVPTNCGLGPNPRLLPLHLLQRIGTVQPPISLTIIGQGLSSGDVQRAAELRMLILSAGTAICICPNHNGQTRTTKPPQKASPLPPRAQSVGRQAGCPGFLSHFSSQSSCFSMSNVEQFPKRPANLAGHLSHSTSPFQPISGAS